MANRSGQGKGKAVVYSGNADSRGGAIFMGDQSAGRDINITTFMTIRPAARETYLKCLNSSELFQPLASELSSLVTVLQVAEEKAFQSQNHKIWDFRMKVTTPSLMPFGYDTELATIMNGCHDVLSEIQKLLQEYDDLPTQTQWTWERVEWSGKRISDLRARLVSNISMLTNFNMTIIMSSQASVEQMLRKFIHEVRTGQRVGSVLSRQMGKPLVSNNQEAWHHIQKELQDVGITFKMFKEHKDLIVALIEQAVSRGGLEDLPELSNLEPFEDEMIFPKFQEAIRNFSNKRVRDSDLTQRAALGHVDRVADLLKEGTDLNSTGDNGETALMRTIVIFSGTPKFLDIKHALDLLGAGVSLNGSEKFHSPAVESASESEIPGSEAHQDPLEQSMKVSQDARERFYCLFKLTLIPGNGNLIYSLMSAVILNSKSWIAERAPRHCCSCQAAVTEGGATRRCETCGGFIDIKCQATVWKMLEDEKHNLGLRVCHQCLLLIIRFCEGNNDRSSHRPEASEFNQLTTLVDNIDYPLVEKQVLQSSHIGNGGDEPARESADNLSSISSQRVLIPMTEASQKLNTKALRELSIAFKPGTKPIASRANPSHPIEHRTLAYQQDFGSTKTKASPPETNSLFKWTIKVPSSWQNQSTSSLPPPISKPEVEAGISSSTEEITQTNSLFKWTIKVPSSWQNQSTSSLPPPISKPEVEAEISSSTEEITQIKRNLLTRMKMLLDAGTDTERQSPHGYTALALAALMPRPLESLLICQLFIQNGANINTAGLNGTTILMRAAARNQEHIVALLLEHGVDVAARDENGDAAWHWATKFGRSKKILEMLKEKGGCVERGEVVVLKQRRNSDETENGNKARHILPLLAEYVYSVEAPEKKHKAVGPDSAFWEEWLDMDKFS